MKLCDNDRMKVIKLGGSLLNTGQFFDCLKHIAKTNEQTVVVCGGGLFANQVRKAQKIWHFDDVAAHEMAILAMQQVAIMCQNLCPQFVIASSVSSIQNNHFVIWSPDITVLNAEKISATWNITSDSLAAWLATRTNAEKLVVVKACDVNSDLAVAELMKRFIVDLAFEEFVKDAKFEWDVVSVKGFLNS